MWLYNLGSLLKILIGASILLYNYNYIHVYQDPAFALGFGFFGAFLFIWGLSFYIYYISQRIFSQKGNVDIASRSYKLSLLTGLFVIINVLLIVMENRNKIFGLIILVVFIALQIMTIKEDDDLK